MRMTASWSGSERTYRIQVRGVKMRRNGEFPSDHTQIGSVATRAPQEKPVSLFISLRVLRRQGAAKHKRR